jgi:hypothetical protein
MESQAPTRCLSPLERGSEGLTEGENPGDSDRRLLIDLGLVVPWGGGSEPPHKQGV